MGGSNNSLAVVGGGVIGLACAIRLAMERDAVMLVVGGDQNISTDKEADGWDARTYALNRLSCRFLESIGVLPLLKRYGVFEAMDVWDVRGGRMRFHAGDIGEPRLGIVVEHTVLMSALWSRLQTLSNVECIAKGLAKMQLPTGDDCACHLIFEDGDACAADFVIGADGARSLVRAQAGIGWQQKDYRQVAQAAVVKTQDDHRNTCLQQFSSAGIAALLPLSERVCAAIWSHDESATAGEFEQFFSGQMGLGRVSLLSELASFPLYGGMADSFIAPHCVLVGDSAHSVHPMAGQGANMGFGDLSALFDALRKSPAKEFSWPVVRRYQRMTMANNRLMKSGIEGLFMLNACEDRLSALSRRIAYNCVDQSSVLKRVFIRYAGGARYRDYWRAANAAS